MSERIKYQGRILEIVEFDVIQAGKNLVFEKARRSPGTRLIIQSGDAILLTKEERHEVGGYDYRLPGGKVFDTLAEYHTALEQGADIEYHARQAAIKEAREEVGLKVGNDDMSFFHKSICGTTVEWDLFYFVIDKHSPVARELEDGEDIEVQEFSHAQVQKMCLDGSINEERSALVLLRYLHNVSQ